MVVDRSIHSYGKAARGHVASIVAGTVAGVALPATEDALKLGFALDSLDSPDPFSHEALVPDAVEEAIK